MRKILFVLTSVLVSVTLFSQVPQAFKYQAVVRDNTGALLIKQSVNFKIDIVRGAVDGVTVYSESHVAITNIFGLVTLEIGNGTTTDDFAAIEWGEDSHFLSLWVNSEEMGTTQIFSVPYAIHSKMAETIVVDGQIKNVSDPTDDQDVATKAYVDRQMTKTALRIQAIIDSISCYGTLNGKIDLTVSGGTPPYYFGWDNGSTAEDLENIGSGTYQVYVEDSNGITALRFFNMLDAVEIDISYELTFSSGAIDITVTGGKPPYSYLWSNGSTSEDQSGLDPGSYTVTVTDALACSSSMEITMEDPGGIQLNSCEGCHTDYDRLIAVHSPDTDPPEIFFGIGAPHYEPYDRVYLGGAGYGEFKASGHYTIGCTGCHNGIGNSGDKNEAHLENWN